MPSNWRFLLSEDRCMATITVAVEGLTDAPVLRRLLAHVGHDIAVVHGGHGKGEIDRNISGYNNAGRFAPWLVLRDLDHDAECPAALVTELLPERAEYMQFRIAVRAMESWLIADGNALARFLSVKERAVPNNPDELENPKDTLVALARQSRRRDIREDMVPARGTSAAIGPAYSSRIEEFAREHWRPAIAATRSISLNRSISRLSTSWVGMP
jgi:hypothetical protein